MEKLLNFRELKSLSLLKHLSFGVFLDTDASNILFPWCSEILQHAHKPFIFSKGNLITRTTEKTSQGKHPTITTDNRWIVPESPKKIFFLFLVLYEVRSYGLVLWELCVLTHTHAITFSMHDQKEVTMELYLSLELAVCPFPVFDYS